MISVIMASFLSIPGRQNLDQKFRRAVNSFINQTYQDKELIIVSDGCEITNKIFEENYSNRENIKLIKIPKQPPYSGMMRNIAFNIAQGDIISYLDADDVLGKNHLQIISDQFDKDNYDFCYYDDYMTLDKDFKKLHIRKVYPRYGSIGTSSITHKNPKLLENGDKIKFNTGYGHDFLYVMTLNAMGLRFKKLEKMPQYIVAHYRDGDF